MKNLLIALFAFCFINLNAQTGNELKTADVIALNAPDSCQASVDALGRYFSRAFKDKAFKLRAIYTWTAMNIFYDVANRNKVNAAVPFNDLVDKTMQTRIAICQGYASVFKALCDACGIRAYLVNGYTLQNGHVGELSHAWVIAAIDTSFYGFDPTWGAGYITNGDYLKRFSDQYFMIKPGDLIRDHMPFDPMWECLSQPVNNVDFSSGKIVPAANTEYFAYADSINAYQAMDSRDQCRTALRRLELAGVTNSLLMDWSDYLRDCIKSGQQNAAAVVKNNTVKQFNDAVASYNNCIYAFNLYVEYWNQGFNPLKSEPDIVGMLELCYTYLDSCKRSLSQVVPSDQGMKLSTDQLQLAIDVARDNMQKQKVFLKIYFNTDPMSRSQLFKNYNGAGLPKSK